MAALTGSSFSAAVAAIKNRKINSQSAISDNLFMRTPVEIFYSESNLLEGNKSHRLCADEEPAVIEVV
ncbi:MAG: hypothetical protein KDK04_14830, partial [Candidatus Competibacteraceae bacterium]|nr:hypothetical protein [Candidatus Competibacteraceae bacterium]